MTWLSFAGLHLVLERVLAAVLIVLVGLLLLRGLLELNGSGRMVGRLSLNLDYLSLCSFYAIYEIAGDGSNVSGASGPRHCGCCLRSIVIFYLFFELFQSLTIIGIVVIDDLSLSFSYLG